MYQQPTLLSAACTTLHKDIYLDTFLLSAFLMMA